MIRMILAAEKTVIIMFTKAVTRSVNEARRAGELQDRTLGATQ